MKTLVRRAQIGDKEARQQLVAALRPRLTNMARYYARCCHEDFDDLLGEAWFAVFESLDVVDIEIGQPDQFLLKRARWRMLDYIKWARRRRCTEPEDTCPEAQCEDSAWVVLDEALLATLLECLSETQQTVLNGLMKGHTWREVAQQMGCTSANVAYHVRQIRRQCEGLVA
ncbi:MAG: sigma-70 family RNA polymerase sigma factor [Acidobacteriota bacterium]|nr:sigma-70 family RNA polymerase sigma factor [Acidobacteriota bacterium]